MSSVAGARLAASSKEAECAREPIHIPGGIQPHGFLLSIDSAGRVLQASENISLLNGRPAQASLGGPLEAVIGAAAAAMTLTALRSLQGEGAPLYAGSIEDPRGGAHAPLALVVHRHAGIDLVELEAALGTADVFSSMYPLVRTFINQLQDAQTVTGLATLAAREIQRITGYGRTMVYSFDLEGTGHVIAEAVEPGYPSYIGQRFPASDIPAQARALYLRNRIRLIADADYVAVPLLPPLHPATGAPTDLTYASLRSVSPVHVQYMKNMRTLSSMSMSIVVRGRLWGLISCHHDSARVAPFEVRTACEHVAQVLSLQIEAKEEHAEAAYRLELRNTLSRLLAATANTDSFVDALRDDPRDLLGLAAAAGAAIVFNGRIERIGAAPDEASIAALVRWLDTQPGEFYATDHAAALQAALPPQPEYAGFMAVSISKLFRNYVIWFRPEVVRTIQWAGDPRARLSDLSPSLSPRESFDTWTEQVRGHSAPWRAVEQEIAVEFQNALLGVVLQRAEEMAQLALELGRVNKELEGFSYTVSHDLRAPLRHIVAFADLVRELDGGKLSERGGRYMERIVSAARFGGQLVDDLLAFSQMGRAALRLHKIDLRALVDGLIADEARTAVPRPVEWRIGALGSIIADPVLLHVVLQNLIDNALKFSGTREHPRIDIDRYPGEGKLAGQDVFFVRDNGVGFDMRYVDKLFGVFERLHQYEEFSGTGIGLASVRRIIERHGGSTWAEGAPEQGACIFFSLPRNPAPVNAKGDETAAEALARLVALSPDRRRQPVLKDTKEGN